MDLIGILELREKLIMNLSKIIIGKPDNIDYEIMSIQ